MTEQIFDLIIVGGGPGGYVAAIRGAQLGMRTAIVERENLGGICLNWGCIPTKALLRTSEINHLLQGLDQYGFAADNIRFDLSGVVRRSRAVAKQLSNGVTHLMRKNKITVFAGAATLAGGQRLTVTPGDITLQAPHIILATGARARELPGAAADGKIIWTYRHAMVPEVMPKRLAVIGSGAIGVEFASFYRDMGAEVTLIEALDRILPAEDAEISVFAAKAFAKQGIRVIVGATVTEVARSAEGATVTVDIGGKTESIATEVVISAIGIVGNVEDLGLEGTGVRVERTHIVTDAFGATGEPGIYAIGDVAGPPWLAHKASHEGVICVENIAGLNPHPMDISNIPGCTYARPQIASVGLTEARARAGGREIRVGRFPFIGNGKAIAMGEAEGLVKVIFDAATGELLGAHMVGAEVTEMIQGYAIARTLEATEAELIHTVFPHPTISETMHEAVLDAYGRVIHS